MQCSGREMRKYIGRKAFGDAFVRSVFKRNRFFSIKLLTWLYTSNIEAEECERKNLQDGFWIIESLMEATRIKFYVLF